jgi:enoyl-CoA hydratase/carnithine racemase
LRAGAGAAVRRGIAIERGCYAPLVRTRDRKEALQAFLERRDPRWIGK